MQTRTFIRRPILLIVAFLILNILFLPFLNADDEIFISSCAEIMLIGNDVDFPLDGSYVLTETIDCTSDGNDIMIGSEENPFIGIFDGGGNNIVFSYSGSGDGEEIGLFRRLRDATVMNLNLTGSITWQGNIMTGALVAHIENYADIDNVHVSVDVEFEGESTSGGIAGYVENASITNSSAVGSYDAPTNWDTMGGIVGYAENISVSNTHADFYIAVSGTVGGFVGYVENGNFEDVSATVDMYAEGGTFGGFAGYLQDGIFNNAIVEGDIEAGELSFSGQVGGFAGYIFDATVTDSSSDVNILAKTFQHRAAGFTGTLAGGSISRSFAYGDIEIIGDDAGGTAGGFVGEFSDGSIFSSGSEGNVTVISLNGYSVTAGGFAGYVDAYNSTIVEESYSTGHVIIQTDTATLGGFAGFGGNIHRSYSTGNIYVMGNGPHTVGGFLGFTEGMDPIVDAYSRGSVTVEDAGNPFGMITVGGFAGFTNGPVFNVYSTGDVTINYDGPSPEVNTTGGFAGFIGYGGDVVSSWSTGEVSTSVSFDAFGGFAGYLEEGTPLVNSSWWTGSGPVNAVGEYDVNPPVPLLAALDGYDLDNPIVLQDETFALYVSDGDDYDPWDFVNVWEQACGNNDNWPYFQWQGLDPSGTCGGGAVEPSVITGIADSITQTTATLYLEITDTGTSDVTVIGFNYGETDSYGSEQTESFGPYASGEYAMEISGLTCETEYHFQAFATNSDGTGTGGDATFTTLACDGSPALPPSGGSGGGGGGSSSPTPVMPYCVFNPYLSAIDPNCVPQTQAPTVPPVTTPAPPVPENPVIPETPPATEPPIPTENNVPDTVPSLPEPSPSVINYDRFENPSLWSRLPSLPNSLHPAILLLPVAISFKDIMIFFTLFGLPFYSTRGRQVRGSVFDSATNRSLSAVTVELVKAHTGEIAASATTGFSGRFSLAAEPGTYRLVLRKEGYVFSTGGPGGNSYHGEIFTVGDGNKALSWNIPMDTLPYAAGRNGGGAQGNERFENIPFMRHILSVLFFLGFVFSAAVAFRSPSTFNMAVLAAYLLFAIFRLVFPFVLARGRIQ